MVCGYQSQKGSAIVGHETSPVVPQRMQWAPRCHSCITISITNALYNLSLSSSRMMVLRFHRLYIAVYDSVASSLHLVISSSSLIREPNFLVILHPSDTLSFSRESFFPFGIWYYQCLHVGSISPELLMVQTPVGKYSTTNGGGGGSQ